MIGNFHFIYLRKPTLFTEYQKRLAFGVQFWILSDSQRVRSAKFPVARSMKCLAVPDAKLLAVREAVNNAGDIGFLAENLTK